MLNENYEKLNNVPKELRAKPNWVGFKVEPKPDGSGFTKEPVRIKDGYHASCTKPTAWTTFDKAVAALRAGRHGINAIGYAFDGDGIVGIDVDHCVGDDGRLSDFAKEVLAKVPSYAEFSPSGTGVHILARCSKPFPGGGVHREEIELYEKGRFFTVTGNVLAGGPSDIVDCTDAVLALYAKHSTPEPTVSATLPINTPVDLSDNDIIRMAEKAKNGAKFTALWRGDIVGYKSHSEADAALCLMLAYWTGRDTAKIDGLFRHSGLMRPKWEEANYRDRTIKNAVQKCSSVYEPKPKAPRKTALAPGTMPTAQSADSPLIAAPDGYYFLKGRGEPKKLTNFVFEPLETLITENGSLLSVNLKSASGAIVEKQLRFLDFNTVPALREVVGKTDLKFSVFATDTELQYIKEYISKLSCPIKTGHSGIGIAFVKSVNAAAERVVFVGADGAFDGEGKAVADIVSVAGSVKIKSDICSKPPIDRASLETLGKVLLFYNELPKTAAVLCFCAACFIKPHLKEWDIKFPHLVMTGEQGSGKSFTYEKVIQPLFSTGTAVGASKITGFTFMSNAGSSNCVPLVIDEYKPSTMLKAAVEHIHNGMRDLYDGHDGERGRADLTVQKFKMCCPLVLIGEESPCEPSIKERSIELLFSKADIADKTEYGANIPALQPLIQSFGKSLLLTALKEPADSIKSVFDACLSGINGTLPPRVKSNVAVCLCGLYILDRLCKALGAEFKDIFGVEKGEVKTAVIKAVTEYTLDGGEYNKTVVDRIIEVFDRMTPTVLKNEVHFKLHPDGRKLALSFKRIYDLAAKYRRECALNEEFLSYGNFTKQFGKKDYCAGYDNIRLKASEFDSKTAPVACFFADIKRLSECADIGNILSAVGYSPPVPVQTRLAV